MLRHLVFFNLKPEVSHADREELFSQIRKLTEIASVSRLAIGTLLTPTDPAYRNHMSADYQYALLVDFQDEAGLYVYQKDAYHLLVAQEIRKRITEIKVLDFVTPE